jgi:hypothetical protein
VAALRSSSREIVEPARPRRRPISRRERPCTLRSAISSRSANERYRPESGIAEDLKIAGGMPPAFRNSLGPTACDTPALSAASSLLIPTAIACQNLCCSARPATGGRPGDRSGARVDPLFRMLIATSASGVLRRPFEPAGCFLPLHTDCGCTAHPVFPVSSVLFGAKVSKARAHGAAGSRICVHVSRAIFGPTRRFLSRGNRFPPRIERGAGFFRPML